MKTTQIWLLRRQPRLRVLFLFSSMLQCRAPIKPNHFNSLKFSSAEVGESMLTHTITTPLEISSHFQAKQSKKQKTKRGSW